MFWKGTAHCHHRQPPLAGPSAAGPSTAPALGALPPAPRGAFTAQTAHGHLPAHPPGWKLLRVISRHPCGLCTHVLSRVSGFSLIPLEAWVAFSALQGTGSTR